MIVVGQVGQVDQSSTRRFVLLDQEYHACQINQSRTCLVGSHNLVAPTATCVSISAP